MNTTSYGEESGLDQEEIKMILNNIETAKQDLFVLSYLLKEDPKSFTIITLDHTSWGEHERGDKWAIRRTGYCLNKNGDWEYEPLPSSRDEEFYKRCRWDSMDEALGFWNAMQECKQG